ncbi:MAG TPA: hypothetical protein PLQ84_00905 [Bacteroidales bacterium]|nr:hypothetical protein [Bacteroidales bacterium]HOG66012.1 hypothetical protein [Bacteroidales bacterium]
MKHYIYYLFLSIIFVLAGCGEKGMKKVDLSETKLNDEIIQDVVSELLKTHGEAFRFRIERGVGQVASLWRVSDGNESEFNAFCQEYFIADEDELDKLFQRLLLNYEILGGNMLRMKKDLMRPLHLDLGPILPVDMLFGSYEPGAHMQEDFFENKIAFVVMLNFPYYSLDEKTQSSDKWSRREWAMARIGDYYTSRVPATLIQNYVAINTAADAYIDNYNIYMGNLIDTNGEKLFPADLRLISHWGLRDELKSNYADENGIEKQKMVYAVMKRIIDQTIPEKVINSDSYDWNPFTNQLFDNSESVDFQSEPDRRYEHMLNNFKAQYQLDPYYPQTPNYIQRQFEANMEIPQQDVEKLFVEFVSSPTVNKVAEYIRSQLGRQLEPFDIWFNGFKAGSKYSQEQLDRITMTRYPNVEEVQNDLPRMLRTLGFSPEKADFIASQIKVEGSRGAGHAWGALTRDDKALLRTRIGANGMDYKGYNIAVHEFGHNVEQTISLHDVDYYSLNRVPNTSFTEALAFIFQKRDLELLGLSGGDPMKEHMNALANFWSCYEIMGVSLVDMEVWKWMYANPNATPEELKEAVITIAKDIWNKYYTPVFGQKDEPILAIYSHMISNPLYLSNYPLGHLIDFQIEQYIADKNFADEILRIYKLGSIIPQQWMKEAVGQPLSTQPTIEAAEMALEVIGNN